VQSAVIPGVPPSELRYGAISGSSVELNPDEVTSLTPNVDLVARDLSVAIPTPLGTGEEFFVQLRRDGFGVMNCVGDEGERTCTSDGPISIPAGSQLVLEVDNFSADTQTFMVGFRLTPA
jgi:hypothetical protein